jgi:hypothetical protein
MCLPTTASALPATSSFARPLKIVIDSGNGIAGASAPAVFRALGCEVMELFSEVDGNFPNHHPDPSKPENLRDVMHALATTDAELGLAFDGDGDRLGIVTKDGQNIYPDRQMMLFARDVLSRVPGAPILFDVKCSQRLAPAIEAAGGQAVMYKTGHSLIKARMRELDSPLGGEMSGHIFFKERWYGFDDGTYAGARLLEILSRSADMSAVLNALPTSFSARPSSTWPAPRASPSNWWPSSSPRAQPVLPRPPRSPPLTACAWTGQTALAWCARRTPRPCWCCVLRATRPRRCTASRPRCWRCCAASSPTRSFKARRIEQQDFAGADGRGARDAGSRAAWHLNWWDARGQAEVNYRWPHTLWASRGPAAEGPACVGFVCGAAMLFRMDRFAAVGFFDEHFFLYYEDDDLCLRLFEARLPMVVVPSIQALHRSRGSVKGRAPWKSEYVRGFHHAQSKLIFEHKHGTLAQARMQQPPLAVEHRFGLAAASLCCCHPSACAGCGVGGWV